MDELTKKIAEHIREIRKLKEYSQEYMAAQLDISQQAYQKIESGKTKISLNCALQIAKLLKIDFEQLANPDKGKATIIPSNNNQPSAEVLHLRKMNSELIQLLKQKSK